MSKTYPECPLFNHKHCREFYNPKLCAIVRKNEICLRKHKKAREYARGKDENK